MRVQLNCIMQQTPEQFDNNEDLNEFMKAGLAKLYYPESIVWLIFLLQLLYIAIY